MEMRVLRLKHKAGKVIGQAVLFIPQYGSAGMSFGREYEIEELDETTGTYVPASLQEGDYHLEDFKHIIVAASVVPYGQAIKTYSGPHSMEFIGNNRTPLSSLKFG